MIKITSAFKTLDRIKELKQNLFYVSNLSVEKGVDVDKIEFVTPLAITPIAANINSRNLEIRYNGQDIQNLRVIHFPDGVTELESLGQGKSYLPIIRLRLSELSKTDRNKNLNALHSRFLKLLKSNVIAEPKFIELISNNTFGYLMGEMLDNIEEHAQADNVYVFAQYWPKTNACELCILDDGDGLLGSLKKANRKVSDDLDALKKIIDTGLSSKTEHGDIKRGMGIKSTRAAITNRELNGEFFIMSGNAAFLHSATNGSNFINFSDYSWKGTVVMMKLNRPTSAFNLYNYVE
jgi:hypothetical protein